MSGLAGGGFLDVKRVIINLNTALNALNERRVQGEGIMPKYEGLVYCNIAVDAMCDIAIEDCYLKARMLSNEKY